MNRAQSIAEIFEPSDNLPVPNYILLTRRAPFLQDFTYRMRLPGGVYDVGMTYDFRTRDLFILYEKDDSFDPGPGGRTYQEIRQDRNDLIQVFRAIAQMANHIRRSYDVHTLSFSSSVSTVTGVSLEKRLDLYTAMTQRIARMVGGRVLPPRRRIEYGREYMIFGVFLLPGLFPYLRTRVKRRFSF